MPRRAKVRGLYQRGAYWLDWDRRADGSLRSPNLAIFWYEPGRGRIRSASARTDDVATARAALDRHYLRHTEGEAICPTCGQRRHASGDMMLLRAITDYLASHEDLTSIGAVRPRLQHVVRYIASLSAPDVRCGKVDEEWIGRFRTWLLAQPVVTSSGRVRPQPRSHSTVENSVLQLAAAINAAHKRGDTVKPAQFQPIQTRELNRTPQRRLSVAELADAFRYATDTRFPRKRLALHRFLMISVGTAARPDAAHDFSTKPTRRQWNPDRRVMALNPAGRRQTKKRRATIIAPWQLAQSLGKVDGPFVPASSVKSAWKTMVDELGWPRDGEGGMKIIRRSVAQLLRDAGTSRAWADDWQGTERRVPTEQIELLLGHREIDSVSDLYAAFDPEYLGAATSALEGVIDAVEALCPGAFQAQGDDGNPIVVPIVAARSA